jgi:hypothetical protein
MKTPLIADADRSSSSSASHRADAVVGLIGDTPCVPLRFQTEGVTIWAKCEFLNPSGSVKDRFASAVIEAAEDSGQIGPDSIILECTFTRIPSSWNAPAGTRGFRWQ